MGFFFTPIPENDWQGLNILLEQLSYRKAQATETVAESTKNMDSSGEYIDGYSEDEDQGEEIAPTPTPTPTPAPTPDKRELRRKRIEERRAELRKKREERKEARKKKIINQDSSAEYPNGQPTVPMVNTVSVVGNKGMEIYTNGAPTENVTLPKDAIVYKTAAKIIVPTSYYLDLRGIYKSSVTQQYTADLLILHDTHGNTVTLENVDETNDISMAGPAAGGRDQPVDFGDGVWVHVFIIYNPTTGAVSSVSSTSATAPTLTGALAGYTFYVRVGAIFVYDAGGGVRNITRSYQMGDRITYNTIWMKWDSYNDSYTPVDISAGVPATAKMVHGVIGLSSGSTARKMAVASDSGGLIKVGSLCDAQGTGDVNYGVSGSKNFSLPILTTQTIWWKTETTGNVYALGVEGFTDDL